MLLKIFYYLYFLTSFANTKYDCNTGGTVYLKPNEISFFETTNYPILMSLDDFLLCDLKFVLNSSNLEKYQLYVAFVQNAVDDFMENPLVLTNRNVYNSSSYSLQIYNVDDTYTYFAQQGHVTFFDSTDDTCPLEFLNPFKITDESQIIFIQSAYELTKNRTKPCNWIYTAPDGYGFKIVIEMFYENNNLVIKNSTQMIINERSAVVQYPYYNSDNYIHIQLPPLNLSHAMEFTSYLSIVKKNVKKRNGNCTFTEKGNVGTWTNDPLKGFENNVNCFYTYILPRNHILKVENFVSGLGSGIEENIDYIKYNLDQNDGVMLQVEDILVIQTDKNSEKNISWEFIADGSLQSSGFKIQLTKIKCECTLPFLFCDGQEHSIMKNTNSYCNNLNCTFTIIPCSTSTTLMTLNYHPQIVPESLMAVFTVKSNGNTVLEINDDNKKENEPFYAYLNSSNLNIFEAITYHSSYVNGLSFTVQPYTIPNVDKHILLPADSSIYVIDTPLINLTLVQIINLTSSLSYAFKVYSSYPDGTFLFEDETLTKSLSNKTCFGSTDFFQCIIYKNKFAILAPPQNFNFPFLAIETFENVNGCLFRETVFILKLEDKVKPDFPISNIATADQECVLTLLIDSTYFIPIQAFVISHLFTTALEENVKVYDGINPFFEFNFSTSQKLSDIRLFSHVYKIHIPKKASMIIYLNFVYNSLRPITIQKFPFNSVVSTPCYGTSKFSCFPGRSNEFVKYIIGNYSVKFTVANYVLLTGDKFYFSTENGTISTFNSTTKSIIFKNQNVTLNYRYADPTSIKSGVLIYIEALE